MLFRSDEWGKRKLAYAIDYKTEGFYVLVTFNAPAELPKQTKMYITLRKYYRAENPTHSGESAKMALKS